jgi:hypothetical protein
VYIIIISWLLQDLQDVAEADIEGLGLKAVAKNRLLRLLSSQKVLSGIQSVLYLFQISKQLHSSTDT